MKKRGKIAIVLSVIVAVFLLIWVLVLRSGENPEWGVTYSTVYAEELGLDVEESYLAVLDELQPASIRIPVYWSRYEYASMSFNFDELDWMMDEAAAREIPVTLAIGNKVPRWPECFIPEWYGEEYQEGLRDYLYVSVVRYRDHPALARWQVENEPYFPFGECPTLDTELLREEVLLVRKLDPETPIQQTTSGEQSFWAFHAMGSDILGVSLYREVKNGVTGPFIFPLNPTWYRVQSVVAHLFADRVVISELQMEPWGVAEYVEDQKSLEAYDHFTAEELAAHMEFASQTGMDEVSLWGVEWWYYLKEMGDDRLWEKGKELMTY